MEIPEKWTQEPPCFAITIGVRLRSHTNEGNRCTFWAMWDLHLYDVVIKWKHFPHYWPVVRGIHRSPVNSPHKGQWRGALMFSLICSWINGWVDNHEAGDLRRHRVHYKVTIMFCFDLCITILAKFRVGILSPKVAINCIFNGNKHLATLPQKDCYSIRGLQ